MKYTVKIVYKGVAVPETIPFVSPICPIYVPANSYADMPQYKGTAFDTNVRGYGHIDLMEPYATTAFPFPVPLAQFKLAAVGTDVTDEDGNVTGKEVTFEVDTYMEAFWYVEAGKALAGQGFEVTVAEASEAAEETEDAPAAE